MKNTYTKTITVILIAAVAFMALGLLFKYGLWQGAAANKTERTNDTCTLEYRVFDDAEKLTDEQEEKLESLIAKKEQMTGADIVLVTIDDASIEDSEALRDYAQQLYEENGFGWDQANGDGVIYVDNWATGDCWLCTTGKAKDKLDSGTIEYIIKQTNKTVNSNPYKAYTTFVNTTALKLNSINITNFSVGTIWVLLLSLLAMGGVTGSQILGDKGKDTTKRDTYVKDGGVQVIRKDDIFLRSHVTRTKIEKNEDHGGGAGGGTDGHGGGGGHH